ncbi:unnamed protein product [Ectocarpus fasciculatus]
MQENDFLSDFFGCVGFLPLTTQSNIREAMVQIMATPARLRPPAAGGGCDEKELFDAIARGADWSKASEWHQLPANPRSCTFWCAIALGALAKGSPFESVTKYSQLAHEALDKSNSGPADAEVAMAWAMLAYLYGFMGDLERHQEYKAVSASFFRSSIEHGSANNLPVGFAEVVSFTAFTDSTCGQRQIKSSSAEGQEMPQLKEAATKGEIYRFVSQSLKAFEQGSHAIAKEQSITRGEAAFKAGRDGRSDGARPSPNDLLPNDVSTALVTLVGQGDCPDFEPLEGAVDRPGIRGGVGSLLINMNLLFTKAAKGDVRATLERIGRCVEVYERYPGLCRGTMEFHKAHVVLSCLAAIDDPRARAMYDRLRGSYNSFRPAGSSPVPPLEEWHGVGAFCDNVFCRATDGLTASEYMKAFSGRSIDGIDAGDGNQGEDNDKDDAGLLGHGHAQREILSACNIPHGIIDRDYDWATERGAACCKGSSVASTRNAASLSSQSSCCQSEAGLHSNRVGHRIARVTMAPGSLSRSLALSEGSEVMEDMEGDSVGTEEWLDVTHAMLDALRTV